MYKSVPRKSPSLRRGQIAWGERIELADCERVAFVVVAVDIQECRKRRDDVATYPALAMVMNQLKSHNPALPLVGVCRAFPRTVPRYIP
jgi:hypothetical protein